MFHPKKCHAAEPLAASRNFTTLPSFEAGTSQVSLLIVGLEIVFSNTAPVLL